MLIYTRRKETDPLPRMFRSARWRSILVVLLAAGCFAFSYYMTHANLVPDSSPERDLWTGVFWMVVAGLCFVAFLPSVVFPTRVTMDSDGFTVRNFWRGEKRYRWEDISHFDIRNLKYPYVVWVNKIDDGNRRRRLYEYDHKLPSALWQYRTGDMFDILTGWLEEYNARREGCD